MSFRQMLAAWIAGPAKQTTNAPSFEQLLKRKEQILSGEALQKTKIFVLTGKQKQSYTALVKARAKRGAPAPTVEEYAAYLRGDAPLASGRMKRTPSWKVNQ